MKSVRFTFALAALSASMAALASTAPVDLKGVANFKDFSSKVTLKKAHLDKLRQNGFVVYPSDDQDLFWVIGNNDYFNIPSLITVDNALQLHHIFFDSTLRMVEEQKLVEDAKSLTKKMLLQSEKHYKALKSTTLEKLALRNVAYFGVADRLLGSKDALLPEAKDIVAEELAKIEAHAGFKQCGVTGSDLDYSQFIVRGHYTKSPKLGTFFKAMMWYGTVPFSTRTSSGQPDLNSTRQALLIVNDLEDAKAEPLWNKIYDITALYAGKSNRLTPSQYGSLAKKVLKNPADLSQDASVLEFIKLVEATPLPAIVAKRNEGSPAGVYQLRFMGQRAIPDSRILQELCEPNLRPFPSPLDVFAVLGSPRAKAIVDAQPNKWAGYKPTRDRLTQEFASLPASRWTDDLYWRWIGFLKPLAKPVPPSYPAFMQSSAWQDKSLSSALASLAELRHDTILYGEQSVAEMGDGDEEQPFAPGYVEPNVQVYRQIDEAAKTLAQELKKRGYAIPSVMDQLADYRKLLSFLITVSEKELAGKKLTKAEHLRIRKLEGDLESLNTTIQTIASNYQRLSSADLDMALVADIHTAYGQALTIAVGHADHLVAVVPINGKKYLARGAALSYYEFLVPMEKRMTDEQWKERLPKAPAIERPAWVKSFFVPDTIAVKE